MRRHLYRDLLRWKQSNRRKPLVLQGARQVGKTWLINAFAKEEYNDYIYLNFEQNPDLVSLFQAKLAPKEIIENISLLLGRKIRAEETLICFDEIQGSPQALTSLKYFYEQAPEFHIIAAGSLLGVQVGKKRSFPVGKVNFMTLYPLSFAEWLDANDEGLLLEQLLKMERPVPFPEIIHQKLERLLKFYLYVGGMPEVVQHYLDNQDIAVVREIQKEILTAYQQDFSKYTQPDQAIKTAELWQSIPFQLAKESKKFKYSDIRKKTRAATYEQTIEWLKSAGLIYLAYQLRTPKLPLIGYADLAKFKIYTLDTGLLGAMLEVSSEIIIQPTQLFSQYNGAFIENYVAMELVRSGNEDLFYWNSERTAEVDFIISVRDQVYPLEVKSGTNRNTKSLRLYADKYKPSRIIRLSPRNFTQSDDFINLPLYAVFSLREYLKV